MTFITEQQFLEIVKKERGDMSLREFAKVLKNKLSIQFLGNVINGAKRPGDKLARALGYEQVAGFRKVTPKAGKKAKAKKPKRGKGDFVISPAGD